MHIILEEAKGAGAIHEVRTLLADDVLQWFWKKISGVRVRECVLIRVNSEDGSGYCINGDTSWILDRMSRQ